MKCYGQITIKSIDDPITIILTNENHTFLGTVSGSAVPSSINTGIIAYKNADRIAVNIGAISTPNGISASITNNNSINTSITFNVTSALTASGTINIPITCDGRSFTKVFTYTLSIPQEGESAKSVTITASSQVFQSNDAGKTFNPDSIKLTPLFQGGVSFLKWQYSVNGGTSWADVSSGSHGLSITSSVLTISKSSDLFTNTVTAIVFKCLSNITTYFDTMTIVKLYYDVSNIQDEIETIVKTEMSGVESRVDAVEKSITNEVWRNTMITVNDEEGNPIQKSIEDLLVSQVTDMNGISMEVQDVKTNISNLEDTMEENVSQLELTTQGIKQMVESNYITTKDAEDMVSKSETSVINQTSDMIEQSVTDNITGANSYVNQKINQITQRVDDADGNISSIQQDMSGITQRVEDNEGNISTLQTTAQGLQSQIENAEGDISTIQQNAQSLQTQVTDNKGNITQLQQNVEGFKTTVTSQLENVNTAIEQNASDIELSATKIEELGNRKVVTSNILYFYLSNSPTQLTGGTWSTTPPVWTQGKYLWQKTVTTYINGTSAESDPVCTTGNTGNQGEKGEAGKSVKSITVEFYLSTSKTTQTGGSWTTAMPTWETGKYLWTRNKIVYENPSSTEYTTPVCDSSWEAANEVADDLHNNYYNKTETEALISVESDRITSTVKETVVETVAEEVGNIQIGGRNLLRNSSLRENLNLWESNPKSMDSIAISQTEKNNQSCTLIDSSSLSQTEYHFWQKIDPGKLELNATYTASAWILAENVSVSNIGTTGYCQFEFTKYQTTGAGNLHYHPYVLDTDGYSDWTRVYWTFTVANSVLTTDTNLYFGLQLKNTTGDFYIRDLQLEKGNTATDWTPAPEDMATAEEVQNAQESADKAQSTADSTESRVTVAESTIQQLSDAISTLVVDENGESMMTQTSDGWRFDMSSINTQLNEARDQLNNLSGDMGQIDQTINNLNDLTNDLVKKTAYIVMTTDSTGAPCIELGKSDNQFKLRITNTSIDFMEGSTRVAYIDNQTLYIERAVIKNELQIGEGTGFIWKKRSNGNMGLRWIG